MSDLPDLRALLEDEEEKLRVALGSQQREAWSGLPVEVVEDSKDGNTVKLKSLIKIPMQQPDGSFKMTEMPEFHDVIVKFQGTQDFTDTYPIKKGHTGFIKFNSRNLDNWHEKDGVQPPVDARQHSLSDGHFSPGGRSKPKKIENVNKDSVQRRSNDHKTVSDWSDKAVSHARNSTVHTTDDTGVMASKDGATHHVTADSITTALGGSTQVVDAGSIDNKAGKIFLNC